jgi:cytochrome c oxidase assembly protein subunit 15
MDTGSSREHDMTKRSGSGLHRFALATAGATFVLLFLGGLVTSTGSGLAVPDWPLSFGQVFPPMVGGVLFEHSHRLAATAVGCLTVVLALWTVVGDARASVRVLGLLALLVVLLQGVLGGVTVLYKLPLAVSVTHACLAQTFFCLTVTLALVTSPAWSAPRPRRSPAALGVLAGITTAAVFGQLVLGALMRHMHAGLAIPDFPLAFGRLVPPLVTPYIAVNFAHRVGALVVVVAIGSTAVHVLRHTDDPWVRRPALLAAALVLLQVTLGALTIWSRRAVLPTTTHLVIGAALLATCLVLALRATRVIVARPQSVQPVGVRGGALA